MTYRLWSAKRYNKEKPLADIFTDLVFPYNSETQLRYFDHFFIFFQNSFPSFNDNPLINCIIKYLLW